MQQPPINEVTGSGTQTQLRQAQIPCTIPCTHAWHPCTAQLAHHHHHHAMHPCTGPMHGPASPSSHTTFWPALKLGYLSYLILLLSYGTYLHKTVITNVFSLARGSLGSGWGQKSNVLTQYLKYLTWDWAGTFSMGLMCKRKRKHCITFSLIYIKI